MEETKILIEILKYCAGALTSVVTLLTLAKVFSKKIKTKFKKAINDLNDTPELLDQIEELTGRFIEVTDKIDDHHKDTSEQIKGLTKELNTINEKLDDNTEATVLTVKYQIVSICNRARNYNGITYADKEILCALYKKYVEQWHMNHHIKSDADFVINNLPTISSYYENK